jgi:hypothetical protein
MLLSNLRKDSLNILYYFKEFNLGNTFNLINNKLILHKFIKNK